MEKKILIITITILLIASFAVAYFFFINQNQLPVPKNISQNVKNISKNVIEICKEKGKLVCHGGCVDGFGEDCYFDSTKYNKDELKTGFSFPPETKEACLGIHSSSVCGNCHNTFELKKSEQFQQVSCEEFFQAIEDKNQSCNNCIDIIFSGCC